MSREVQQGQAPASSDEIAVRSPARMKGAERRAQIARATTKLVGKYGIAGTTIARIAREVGLSEMAAYRHFGSKTEMLAEAHRQLMCRTLDWFHCSSKESVAERLREVGLAHAPMLTCDVEMYSAPMVQFIFTPQEDPFKREQVRQFSEYFDAVTEMLEEGRAQGSIRDDLDPVMFAHMWISWAQGEDAHYLVAGKTQFRREPHLRILDLIISDIAAPGADNR